MIYYTNQVIENEHGAIFKVLDTNKLNFNNAVYGIKTKVTMVKCAKGGELIETKNNNGEIESSVIAQSGDAIFCNNSNDIYIPHNKNGEAMKFDKITEYGYKIIGTAQDSIFVKNTHKALLLVDAIKENTCILNAFGEGIHQFLYSGASLKKDISTGEISGIDKYAFDSTWKILPDELTC